jgi:hypothetical protein
MHGAAPQLVHMLKRLLGIDQVKLLALEDIRKIHVELQDEQDLTFN